MSRVWVYERMKDDTTLMALLPGGIHASTSLDKAPEGKPFIMYRNTSDVALLRGDDSDLYRQQGFMILVHDHVGDYMGIDEVIARLRVLFADAVDQEAGIRSIHIETSDDWRDEDMGTVMKYIRIQLNYMPVAA